MTRQILLAALALSLSGPLQLASAAEIGYVDMQRVLEESTLGRRLQEQLRKEFEPRAQEMAKEEGEIAKLQQDLERDKPLMSAEQLEKQEGVIKERIQAYQKKAVPVQQELMQAQQEKGREIIGPAREAIGQVAKKQKLQMVVERGINGMLYMDESLDVTKAVIEALDAKTK